MNSIDAHFIHSWGYVLGSALLVIAIVGLICVGVLLGWAGRDRAVARAYADGQKAGREERPQRPVPHPALTMEIPKIRHSAHDTDATQQFPRWRQP